MTDDTRDKPVTCDIETYAAECESLEKEATPGPWKYREYVCHFHGDCSHAEIEKGDGSDFGYGSINKPEFENAKFIANARTAEPFWRKLAMEYRKVLIRLDSKDRDEEKGYAEQGPIAALAVIEAYRKEAREALALTREEVEKL